MVVFCTGRIFSEPSVMVAPSDEIHWAQRLQSSWYQRYCSALQVAKCFSHCANFKSPDDKWFGTFPHLACREIMGFRFQDFNVHILHSYCNMSYFYISLELVEFRWVECGQVWSVPHWRRGGATNQLYLRLTLASTLRSQLEGVDPTGALFRPLKGGGRWTAYYESPHSTS